MDIREQVIYLSLDEAMSLVCRINKRTTKLGLSLCDNEMEAMSDLLSDLGVKVSDVICVKSLADNYRYNAEIVEPDEVENYNQKDLDNALFSWKKDGERYYCLSW